MAYKDYYKVLGLARGASEGEIKQAYRKLARKYHPDVSKEPGAEQRFKDINEANDVLKDESKRKLYDQYGESWKAVADGHAAPRDAASARDDFGAAGFSVEDDADLGSLFEQFFGGGGRGARRAGGRAAHWADKGGDQEAAIELSVEDAFRGGERSFALLDSNAGEQRQYTVRIPAGVRAGQRIRLAGQGQKGADGAGDLYLRVQLLPSDVFRLEDDDVFTSLPVAPWEAALGASATLRTLDGNVRVKIPAGSSSGRQIRLKNKGYPKPDGTRGDLYGEIRVLVPPELSDEEKTLVARWGEISKFAARPEDR